MTAVASYLLAIIVANLAAARFGPGAAIPIALALIGFDLSCRDYLQQRWEGGSLWRRMLALIVAGGACSWWINAGAGQIAVASTVSFVLVAGLDAVVFALMGHRVRRLVRWNGTNVVGAAVDSLVFPTLAFGGLMPAIVVGQFVAKLVGGFLWSVVLTRAVSER